MGRETDPQEIDSQQTDPKDTASIRNLVQACQRLLERLLQEEESKERDYMEVESHWTSRQYAEFNLWSVKIGANGQGHRSIDIRLKDVPETCKIISRLLQSLNNDLEEISQPQVQTEKTSRLNSSDNESDCSSSGGSSLSFPSLSSLNETDAEAVSSYQATSLGGQCQLLRRHIADTIDRLHDQALQIDKAGVNHRHARIELYKKKNQFAYQGYRNLAFQRARDQFPLASNTFQTIMAESFARRRIRFDYLRAHQKKRALESTTHGQRAGLQPRPISRLAEAARALFQDQKASETPNVFDRAVHDYPKYQDTIYSATVNTKLENCPEPRETERAESVASVMTRHVGFPPTPKIIGTSFQCPYCCLEFRATEAQKSQWSRHVMQDFEPYFCIHDGCISPFDVPNTFEGLLKHLQADHIEERFHIDMPNGKHEELSETRFEEYINQHHSITSHRMKVLKEASRRKGPYLIRKCPFCGGTPDDVEKECPDPETPAAQMKMRQHIKRHMQDIALFLPPYREDIFESDQPGVHGSDFSRKSDHMKDDVLPEDHVMVCGRMDCGCIHFNGEESEVPALDSDDADFWPSLFPDLPHYDKSLLSETYCLQDRHLRALVAISSSRYRTAEVVDFASIESLLIKESKNTGKRVPRRAFLPAKAAESLVQRDRVETTLERWFNAEEQEKTFTTDYVMEKANKVFLILSYMEEWRDHRKSLPVRNFTFADNCLPIQQPDGSVQEQHSPQEAPWVEAFGRSSTFQTAFFRTQWLFLAPTFRTGQFTYEFDDECILPFVDIDDAENPAAHFGSIFHLGLRVDHILPDLDMPTSRMQFNSTMGYIEVALKVTTVEEPHSANTNVEKFFCKEKTTLDMMRSLEHPHLVKAIAAYKKENDRCFLFPWADGGNLRSFWALESSKIDTNMVNWAVHQMCGISDGIRRLHDDAHSRHGDIKPSNILYFRDSDSGYLWGNLVVADVGITKVDQDYTGFRDADTAVKHGTTMYEPPEMADFDWRTKIISPKYDMWSLGCIFLEFTIWLLYGQNGLNSFYRDLGASNNWRLWVPTQNGHKLHKAVLARIDDISSHSYYKGALGGLFGLIRTRLLVSLEERIDAKSFSSAFEEIRREFPVERLSDVGPNVHILAEKRSEPIMSSTSGQELIPASNQWAQTLMSRLDWVTLRPKTEAANLCASCRTIDFLSIHLSLGRSLEDLGEGAAACPMCHFLHQSLSKYALNRDEVVGLSADIDKHAFMLSKLDIPAISVYFNPESSNRSVSQAQLGLPLLPGPGSSQQFTILNEWIGLCNKYHRCVSDQVHTGKEDILPTRLVDVGTIQSPSLCLVETKLNNVTGHYVFLSYCWGQDRTVCTISANIDSFKKDIPFNILPRTLQDAVIITRALGVQYIWIDCLCVVQDSADDWVAEVMKMEDVFSSAYCRIAASSSQSFSDGFLLNRAQRAAVGIQTSQGTLYLAEAIDDFQEHVEQSILNRRGWMLQERALSRRTIHFTSTQVYWECGDGVKCETLAELRNPQSMFLGDPNFPTYGLAQVKGERIRLIQYLYQVYSGMCFARTPDRSVAIRVLQKRLSHAFNSRIEYGVISSYFERTLLWQAEVPGSLSLIDSEASETIPSWSWMAVMGGIRYVEIPFDGVTWTGDLENPFQPGSDDAEWDGQFVAKAKRLLIDDVEFEKRCKVDVSDYKFEPSSWKCVVVGEGKVANEDGDIDQYALLIREKSSVVTPPVYERVGVGILLQTHVALETTVVHIA